jgi:hypothetical protein
LGKVILSDPNCALENRIHNYTCKFTFCTCTVWNRNRNINRNKFINQIRAQGGHIQITIMIDTQQQYK